MQFRFEKLQVWQDARHLINFIYSVTKNFPNSEKFALVDQLRRAAVSIALNIAEGSDRKSDIEFTRYLRMAITSTEEVVTALYISLDQGYIKQEDFDTLYQEAHMIVAKLNALIKSLRSTDYSLPQKNRSRKSVVGRHYKGFTLIELLVVISIIAVLSTIGLVSYQGVQSKGRDSIRKSNLNTLATALEIYYQKNSHYPGSTNPNGCDTGATGTFYDPETDMTKNNGIAPFISGNQIPTDPKDSSSRYCYISEKVNQVDAQGYRLFANLENCQDPVNPLCSYNQNNYSLVSDNLTIQPAPGSIAISSLSPSTSTPTSQPNWTENWDSLSAVQSRWSSIGSACYSVPQAGILDMVCQSAGLVSNQYFDKSQPITVTGTVRAQPATGSTTDAYWGGLTLYNNNGADNNYGQLAAQRNVPPFGGDHTARIISLTDDAGSSLATDTPWTWHNFKIVYLANGTYNYYVEGNLVKTVANAGLTANPDIFILCVSVGSGVGNDGSSSHCQFGPIAVYGVLATPPPPPLAKRVFVTKNWVSGAIGGLAGADAWCQSQANQASLGGSWKAWLSDSLTSASSRLSHYSGPYKLVDGSTTVANSWNTLISGNLSHIINMDQFKADASSIVTWTNTNADGTINSTTNNCSSWTSQSSALSGNSGQSGFADSQWTKFNSSTCNSYRPLYCFEQ